MGEEAQQRLLARQVTIQGCLRAGWALGGQNRHLWGPQECKTSHSIYACHPHFQICSPSTLSCSHAQLQQQHAL